MGDIKLRKDNVVKSVDSEDNAKALEAKGFVRTDGKTVKAKVSGADVEKMAAELENTRKELAEANAKLEKLESHAEKAEKRNVELENELLGTREQLDAALKKNKAADKK